MHVGGIVDLCARGYKLLPEAFAQDQRRRREPDALSCQWRTNHARTRFIEGQRYPKVAAPSRHRTDTDFTTHGFDKPFGDGEAKTGALETASTRGIGLNKIVEDLGLF